MDLNNIDVKQLHCLPKLAQLGLFAGLFIVLLFGGYCFFISGTLSKTERFDREIKTLSASLNFQEQKLANSRLSKESLKKLQAKLLKLQTQLPSRQQIPALVDAIAKAAAKAGLKVEVIKPQKVIERLQYLQLPIQMQLQGNFREIKTFLNAISNNTRIVTVIGYELVPMDPKKPDQLKMSLVMNTYTFKPNGENQG